MLYRVRISATTESFNIGEGPEYIIDIDDKKKSSKSFRTKCLDSVVVLGIATCSKNVTTPVMTVVVLVLSHKKPFWVARYFWFYQRNEEAFERRFPCKSVRTRKR